MITLPYGGEEKKNSLVLSVTLTGVIEQFDQNPARTWTTPHYAVIAGFLSDGFPSMLKLGENPDISGWSKKLHNM